MSISDAISEALEDAEVQGILTGFIVVVNVRTAGDTEQTLMIGSEDLSHVSSMGLARAAVHMSDESFMSGEKVDRDE